MSQELVTIAAFESPIEAHLARNRLEAEGIQVFLADELTVGNFWNLSNAVGGIKVQVADKDGERAVECLESFDKHGTVESPDAVSNDAERVPGEGEEQHSDHEDPREDEEPEAGLPLDSLRKMKRAILWTFFLGPFLVMAGLGIVALAAIAILALLGK